MKNQTYLLVFVCDYHYSSSWFCRKSQL